MAETGATQKMTARHFLVLLTCITCTFGPAAITFSCPGLCYKPVADALGVQVSDVSFYMSLVYLSEVVFSAPVGALLEKFDMRIICTIAAVCTSVGVFMMSTYTQVWQWYISGVFMGFGEITMLWLMVAGLLNRWYKKKLGFVIGLSYAMTGVGGAVFNIVGQFVLGPDLSGWRNLYMIFGICSFVLSVPFTLFCIKSHPQDCGMKAYGAELDGSDEEVSEAGHIELPGMPAKEAYKKWYFYVLILAGCLMNVAGIYPQHYTTWFQAHVAIDFSTGEKIAELMIFSGTLEAFSMVGMAVGKVTTGAIESKSIQAALIFGCVTGLIGLSMIWQFGEAKNLYPMWAGGFIYGVIYAFVTTLLPYLTRLIFGEKDYDRIYSVVLIPVNLVGAFAASGLALIYQSAGWGPYFIVGLVNICLIYVFCTIAYKGGSKDYRDKASA